MYMLFSATLVLELRCSAPGPALEQVLNHGRGLLWGLLGQRSTRRSMGRAATSRGTGGRRALCVH